MKRRIWIFSASQFAPAGSGDPAGWRRQATEGCTQSTVSNCDLLIISAIVILASMATIGCALVLSNPTHEKPNPNPHQGYCGELDYNRSDPVWEVLQSFSVE